MKKLISLFLVIVMVVSCVSLLAACDSENTGGTDPTESNTTNGEQNTSNDNNNNNTNNNNNNTPAAKAEWISNRSISYVEDTRGYRFCFALKDKSENYIACNARVEMAIVNEVGETVYSGTKNVTTNDYGEWYNLYGEWLGTAVYIYDNELTAGLSDEGTFYYKVITDDNWFEYSLDIYDLPTYTPSFEVGEKWLVDGVWEFSIDSVEYHYPCGEEDTYRNNNLAQYVIITYTYKNIGYSSYKLDFNFTAFSVYDETGEIGEFYSCWEHCKDADYLNVGGKCTGAQVVFGLHNESDEIRICIEKDNIIAEYVARPAKCTHAVVTDKGYAATCVQKGLTDGTHCSKCGLVLTKQTEIPVSNTNHNYSNGYCSWCFEKDPSFKTPDLVLGEYVQSHGTKQSNGEYVISWEDDTSMTQIIWNPTTKSLIFAQVNVTSIGVTTAGIIYEHGAYKQKITVINDQKATGYKITGIGYIYSNTFTITNNDIYSYQCDATSSSLVTASKSLAESCITVLVDEIDDWLFKNTDFDISDFGFTSW